MPKRAQPPRQRPRSAARIVSNANASRRKNAPAPRPCGRNASGEYPRPSRSGYALAFPAFGFAPRGFCGRAFLGGTTFGFGSDARFGLPAFTYDARGLGGFALQPLALLPFSFGARPFLCGQTVALRT